PGSAGEDSLPCFRHQWSGKMTKDNWSRTIDVENTGGSLHLQILVDRSSLEVFVNHGERVLSTHIFPDKGADLLAAFSQGGAAGIHSLKIWNLSAANETP